MLAACAGAGPADPPVLPADALPGRAEAARTLEAADLSAAEADPAEALGVLDDAGFAGAVERNWTQPERRRRAEVRLIAFGGADGAERYLAWLRAHVGEPSGTASPGTALATPAGAAVAVREPSGCCPKEGRTLFVTWREGSIVVVLAVSGPRVRLRDAAELAPLLARAV